MSGLLENQDLGLGLVSGSDSPSASGSTSLYRFLFAICLLVSLASCCLAFWSVKFGQDHPTEATSFFKKSKADLKDAWVWEPFEVEKALYRDRGYNIDWLEKPAFEKIRTSLGIASPIILSICLRCYGVLSNLFEFLAITAFVISLGRVHYHEKIRDFAPVSSTIYYRAFRLIIFGIFLTWLWIVFPFGVSFPIIGEVAPTLTDWSNISVGVFWVSSPALGFWLVCAVIEIGVYFTASNLRSLS